jgi:hypothetical protein
MQRQPRSLGDVFASLRQKMVDIKRLPQWLVVLLAGLVLALGLWVTLAFRPSDNIAGLQEGQPSPLTITAPRRAEFISDVMTRQRQAEAESDPGTLQYTTNFALPRQQREALQELLKNITRVREDPTFSTGEKEQRILALSSGSVAISPTLAMSIISLDDAQWEEVRTETLELYDQALIQYDYKIDDTALEELHDILPHLTYGMPDNQANLVLFFTNAFLRVNRTLNQEATERQKREAVEAVEPAVVTVQAGETIVSEGDIVNGEMMEKLRETGALPKPLQRSQVLGLGLMASLMSALFMLYLTFLQPDIVQQTRPLMIIIGSILITALTARWLLPSIWVDQSYAFPLATTILVLAAVFNGSLALATGVLLSFTIGMLDHNSLSLATTMLLGCGVAVFVVRNPERSLTFLLAGIAIALVITASEVAFLLVRTSSVSWGAISQILLFSGMNGSLSSIFSLGLFNIVGNAAGIITTLKLMELAHPEQPLLRKLMREAPGTHFHSVSVGNLAESAAEAIGADALLLRVAAYYHDIGKTIRPFFFTDNQIGRENVHNDLDPHTSADIILDHVREGIKMAKAAGLPQPIIDFIATHHGTQEVSFFYQMAIRQHDSVNIEDFRYPGPKPFTREQGIMMLADSVEATIRSKNQHGKLVARPNEDNGQAVDSVQAIDELVGSIIDDRVRSGQLDNAPLTLHDLKLIRQAFVSTLKGIYHPRVEYPSQMTRTT